MSVQCNVCSKAITAANDRVFCFGGCGQVLHAKCADLTTAEATALRENVSMKYMCHDCGKKQVCYNTMMTKCEEIVNAINDINLRLQKIESNCERNNVGEMIAKSEQNIKTFFKEAIAARMGQFRNSGDQCLTVENLSVRNNDVFVVGEGPVDSDENLPSSYAAVTRGDNNLVVNHSVLRSGRVRNKSSLSTPKTGGNGRGANNVQNNANAENLVHSNREKNSKKMLDCIVRIKPAVQQSNQQTKKEVRNKINPSQMGIKSVRNGMNGAIVVECGSKNEAEGLVSKLREELGENYAAKVEEPRRPRIKIIGAEDEYESDDLKEILTIQNDICDIQYFQILKTIKHRRGVYTEFTLICETDSGTFEQIMRKRKLFIDLSSCRVKESIDILRCFKCCGYAHKAQECKNELHCAKCAGSHDIKECSSEQLKCINCAVSNKDRNTKLDVNHAAWSFNCPIYSHKIKQSKKLIGYEK